MTKKLQWVQKSAKGRKTRSGNIPDISIAARKNGRNSNGEIRWGLVFIFYNKALEHFKGFIEFALDDDENKVYFRSSDAVSGYKMQTKQSTMCHSAKVQISIDAIQAEYFKNFAGDYLLTSEGDGIWSVTLVKKHRV